MKRQLSTEAALLIAYGDVNIPLSEICEKYLGLNKAEANRQARARATADKTKKQLPITAFRLTDSQKSPWLVRVSDLARFTDKAYEEAKSVEV